MKYKPYEITVESVYGFTEPAIPAGLESTGEFRPSKTGECYLTTYLTPAHGETDRPRIILRKKKRKQIVLTEVGVGLPKKGQYWEDRLGNRVLCMAQEDACGSWFDATTIYEREDKEI